MKCHYCGTELPENASFCRHCGTRRAETQSAEPVYQAPQSIYQTPPAPQSVYQAPPEPRTPVNPYEFPMPKAAPLFDEADFTWKPRGEMESGAAAAATAEETFPVINAAPLPVQESPRIQLPVKRSLVKMIFLSILTFGIYPVVIWSRIVTELNIAASRHDGRRTMSYFGMLMLSPITLGIYALVWMHEFSDRIGCELRRRDLGYKFGAGDFWLWNFLYSLLILASGAVLFILIPNLHYAVWAVLGLASAVGPFVYIHKLMKSMNYLNGDFNLRG